MTYWGSEDEEIVYYCDECDQGFVTYDEGYDAFIERHLETCEGWMDQGEDGD